MDQSSTDTLSLHDWIQILQNAAQTPTDHPRYAEAQIVKKMAHNQIGTLMTDQSTSESQPNAAESFGVGFGDAATQGLGKKLGDLLPGASSSDYLGQAFAAHPNWTGGGELLGTAALGEGMAGIPVLAGTGNTFRGAVIGGTMGGVRGAADAPPGTKLPGAALGTGFGALTGGLLGFAQGKISPGAATVLANIRSTKALTSLFGAPEEMLGNMTVPQVRAILLKQGRDPEVVESMIAAMRRGRGPKPGALIERPQGGGVTIRRPADLTDAARSMSDAELSAQPLGQTPPLGQSAAAPGVTDAQATQAAGRMLQTDGEEAARLRSLFQLTDRHYPTVQTIKEAQRIVGVEGLRTRAEGFASNVGAVTNAERSDATFLAAQDVIKERLAQIDPSALQADVEGRLAGMGRAPEEAAEQAARIRSALEATEQNLGRPLKPREREAVISGTLEPLGKGVPIPHSQEAAARSAYHLADAAGVEDPRIAARRAAGTYSTWDPRQALAIAGVSAGGLLGASAAKAQEVFPDGSPQAGLRTAFQKQLQSLSPRDVAQLFISRDAYAPLTAEIEAEVLRRGGPGALVAAINGQK